MAYGDPEVVPGHFLEGLAMFSDARRLGVRYRMS